MDCQNSTKTFVEKDQSYVDSWAVLSRGRREQQQTWVSNIIIPKVALLLNGEEQMKILSVGSGNGSFDMIVLEELENFLKVRGQTGKKIEYHVLEPNIELMGIFRAKTETVAMHNLTRVQFSWANKLFEHYLNDYPNHTEFDLIIMSHCLYYMNEADVIRQTFGNLLAEKGYLVIITGTEGDIWTQLRQRYEKRVPSLAEFHYPTEKSISELAKSNGWHYECFKGKQDLEITEIFDEESATGDKLLEFFFHHENPRKTFGQELLTDILGFFSKAEGNSVKTIGDKKRWYAKNDDGIVLIFKD